METRTYWAYVPYERDRRLPFASLDSLIPDDDQVRMVDEVLCTVDWTPWEAKFSPKRGQPPIHPRWLAAAYLYGLYRGIRSSRKLEEACAYRFDFMWLLKGQRPDHTTFAKFRTKFHEPLKDLFKQIGRMAMAIGLIRLGDVAFDGTRVKANNSRFRTATADRLEKKLRELDELFERATAQTAANDEATAGPDSPTHLPPDVADLEQRREKLRAALERAQAADKARHRKGVDPAKNPAQVPLTDLDSRVMPNKEGGYAPNYTPTQVTDAQSGMVVAADVVTETNESGVALSSVDQIKETFGVQPQAFLTDAGNSTGEIMEAMEQRGIEFLAPAETHRCSPGHPAYREDPHQPVDESRWPDLPRNNQKQLDKSNFIYDAEQDQYYCPRGQVLIFEETKPELRGETRLKKRVYRCHACSDCPLAQVCVSRQSKGGRTVSRDQFEEVRERTAARMTQPNNKQRYHQRPCIAETTFGIMKSIMGLRQFLLRGLKKVKIEWTWTVTAFNLMKVVRYLATLRAQVGQLAVGAEG